MPLEDDRLATAAAFVAELYRLSRYSPRAWRRADGVCRSIGVNGERLDRALVDAERAGLIDRRADDALLVLLNERGRALAADEAG